MLCSSEYKEDQEFCNWFLYLVLHTIFIPLFPLVKSKPQKLQVFEKSQMYDKTASVIIAVIISQLQFL